MFQFIGYNFFGDKHSLDSAPSMVDNITSIKLTNAIYDHMNITRNTSAEISTTIPTEWDYDTVMDADFNGNLNGGNVDFLVEEISAIKVKRREKGAFDWLTLETVPINKAEDLDFVFNDNLNKYGVEYEYAFVPILNDIEGDYIINSIMSTFRGVFIGDVSTIYKFLYEVDYGTNVRQQQVGTFQVLGKQFPVIVANGLMNYETGQFSALVLNDDFEETRQIDPQATTEKLNTIKDYLSDKKPKFLKDNNGNMWLIIVTANLNTTYKSSTNNSIPTIGFDWTQIGYADNQQDLYNNGMIDEV